MAGGRGPKSVPVAFTADRRVGHIQATGLDDAGRRQYHHLDFHADDVEAEVTRLERLGAVRVRKVHTWWVMRDPVGLVFCVLPAAAESLTEENSIRWD